MKRFALTLAIGLLGLGGVIAQIRSPQDSTHSIWFHSTPTFGHRFLYAQTYLWPSSIAGHVGLYILKDDFDWSSAVKWERYKKTFSSLPKKIDQDHWSWNFEVHPYMGSQSYLTYRNRGGNWIESFGGAALNSTIYEYVIAGGTQSPSFNDLIVTPIAGSILGEGLYQFKGFLLKDNYLNMFEKINITIIDPFDALYYGFNYRAMAKAR